MMVLSLQTVISFFGQSMCPATVRSEHYIILSPVNLLIRHQLNSKNNGPATGTETVSCRLAPSVAADRKE